MDLLIAGVVAVAVFIYLGRALPTRTLYDPGAEFDERDGTPRRGLAATKLTRGGAITISLGVIVLFGSLLRFAPSLDTCVAVAIVAISLWATADSHKVRLRTYQTKIALHPIALFNAMMLLWPVFFPWYLIICSKIGDGTLPQKSKGVPPGNKRTE